MLDRTFLDKYPEFSQFDRWQKVAGEKYYTEEQIEEVLDAHFIRKREITQEEQDELNRHCLSCSLKYCPSQCFDIHIGSRIALGKAVTEFSEKKGKKVYIAGDIDRNKEEGDE